MDQAVVIGEQTNSLVLQLLFEQAVIIGEHANA